MAVNTVSYLVPDDSYRESKPYIWRAAAVPELPITNCKFEDKPVNLTDVRSLADEDKPKLDTHGFCFANHKSKNVAGVHDDSLAAPYVDEMTDFLKKFLGAETVIGFNARARSSGPELTGAELKVTGITTEAHIDVNKDDVWPVVSAPLTEDERDLVRSGKFRARIINVWRPRVDHAEDFPLAVCDPNSIDPSRDIILLDNAGPKVLSEVSNLRHSPESRWYWLSNQTPEEVIIFTQSDSHPPKGRFREDFNHVPHASFRNQAAREGCPPRRSVEARFIVLEPAPYSPPARNPTNGPQPDARSMPYIRFVEPPYIRRVEAPAPASKEDRGITLSTAVSRVVDLKSTPHAVKAN